MARVITKLLPLLCAAATFSMPAAASAPRLPPLLPTIVTNVTGRAPSSGDLRRRRVDARLRFCVRVARRVGPGGGGNTVRFFSHLECWSASRVLSPLPADVSALLLRVRRAGGAPRTRRPPRRACLTLPEAPQRSLRRPRRALRSTFDGAFDATDTGPSYRGPPVTAFTWYVPPSAVLPDADAASTIVVRPGDALPNASALSPSTWPTVVFAPGVHRTAAPFANSLYRAGPGTPCFLCAGSVAYAALSGTDPLASRTFSLRRATTLSCLQTRQLRTCALRGCARARAATGPSGAAARRQRWLM
jgi:hypothetical protein